MSVLSVELGLSSLDSDTRDRPAAMVELQNAAMKGKGDPGTSCRVSYTAGPRAPRLHLELFTFVKIVRIAAACAVLGSLGNLIFDSSCRPRLHMKECVAYTLHCG